MSKAKRTKAKAATEAAFRTVIGSLLSSPPTEQKVVAEKVRKAASRRKKKGAA